MTPAEYATWKERRKVGRWRYILQYNVLTKGVAFATLMAALQWFGVIGRGVQMSPWDWVFRFTWLATLYGIVMGWLDWSAAEARFEEGPESDELEPEIVCLKCEAVIPVNEHRCPSCGWSFEDEGIKSEDRHEDTTVSPAEDL